MVPLILVVLGLYIAMALGRGLFHAMPAEDGSPRDGGHLARTKREQEEILCRHQQSLSLGFTPLMHDRATVQLVIGTHTGPVRAEVDALTELGLTVRPERPLPEGGAGWRLGYLEVGGERYLDVVLGQIHDGAPSTGGAVLLEFLEQTTADAHALARLSSACFARAAAA